MGTDSNTRRLQIHAVSKTYGDVLALDEVSLEPDNGELITILGPSGCGKTTLLRLIAGFEAPDSGKIIMGGRTVSNGDGTVLVPPEKRHLGMVFQTYAIWPHMTVASNVAYPLTFKQMSKAEIRARTSEVLELVDLGGYERRTPGQLSGGQQQRVALARALVSKPNLLLLDEPLSNLDAKLREQTRRDIREIQRKAGITTILVTHDQAEAIELSDRIVVLTNGKVAQVGTPFDLYRRPASAFVADFVGAANLIEGRYRDGQWLLTSGAAIETNEGPDRPSTTLVVRPEDLVIDADGRGFLIRSITFSGPFSTVLVTSGAVSMLIRVSTTDGLDEGQEVGLRATRQHYLDK